MPAQDCARCDHAMSSQHLRQRADERGEDRSIRQSIRDLGFALRKTATSWRSTRISTSLDLDERPNNNSRFSSPQKDRVKQTQRHKPRSCPDGWPHRSPWVSGAGRPLEPLTSSANSTAPSCQRLINKGAEWTVTDRKLTRELDQQP